MPAPTPDQKAVTDAEFVAGRYRERHGTLRALVLVAQMLRFRCERTLPDDADDIQHLELVRQCLLRAEAR